MKIGISCADEKRFRQIIKALEKAEFFRAPPDHDGPHLDLVLLDREHADEIACSNDHGHPCTFTRRPDGNLDVQCGRQREMTQRAASGIPSNKSLTMIFQDNTEAPATPSKPDVIAACQC